MYTISVFNKNGEFLNWPARLRQVSERADTIEELENLAKKELNNVEWAICSIENDNSFPIKPLRVSSKSILSTRFFVEPEKKEIKRECKWLLEAEKTMNKHEIETLMFVAMDIYSTPSTVKELIEKKIDLLASTPIIKYSGGVGKIGARSFSARKGATKDKMHILASNSKGLFRRQLSQKGMLKIFIEIIEKTGAEVNF